eukprot:GHVN01024316.1.p1 GENE.GHVN01024316.1~~GHVN01024316.1.p1  ORF type:complete len:464 (-),score=96.62 GHVN01024316.1:330-1721(-)
MVGGTTMKNEDVPPPEPDTDQNEAKESDDGDESDAKDEMSEVAADGAAPTAAKKKRKKKKKKKSSSSSAVGGEVGKVGLLPAQDNSKFRLLGSWPAVETRQTSPPTVPIDELYPNETYPVGQISEYIGGNGYRYASEEMGEKEKLVEGDYQAVRRAAECHRQVRKFAQSYIEPGMSMIDIVTRLETKGMELVKANKLEAGRGFPTGVSVNHCAAHYTPNYGDERVLQASDVVKVDFGIQVRGRIVDSAFTIAFDEKYDNIIKASQDGTNAGLAAAGIDARFGEVGEAIQEAIESYEHVESNGTAIPIHPIRNLNGHSIDLYRVHGGKSVPIIKTNDNTRMEEGEFYAIETFASTGKGVVQEADDCSHYMRVFDKGHVPLRLKTARDLLKTIDENFRTLAFCRRWLDDLGHPRHLLALKNLVQNDLVRDYPPLVDSVGSIVSQMEHTVILRPTCKEIVSRGDDY